MEARLANHAPVAVTHHAPGIDEAFRGAEGKVAGVVAGEGVGGHGRVGAARGSH